MSNYIKRELIDIELPLIKGVDILHPEKANLVLDNDITTHKIDVGSICYLNRIFGNNCKKVELDSFLKNRKKNVIKLIQIVSDYVELSGSRPKTIRAKLANFLRFVDWCDENSFEEVFDDINKAKEGFREYILSLRYKLREDIIKSNSAVLYQNQALQILKDYFECYDFHSGLNLIHASKDSNLTELPDDKSIGRVLALSTTLFDGISELVINNRKYPFKIKAPKYLGWPGNFFWIFPTNRWYMTPEELLIREELNNSSWAYDYFNGKLSNAEDIRHHYSEPSSSNLTVKKAQDILEKSNSDKYYQARIRRAMTALNAFYLLFLANTGMNSSSALSLEWNDDFEVEQEIQGFRIIKFRANNKIITFQIESSFLKKFKKYLKLRNYLLKGLEYKLLFFSLGGNCFGKPKPQSATSLTNFYNYTLKKIDPNLNIILSRGFRAAKADYLINHTDVSTASKLLGNTEDTLLEHYNIGSESKSIEEMSSYLELVSEKVLKINEKPKNKVDTNIIECELGECSSYKNPSEYYNDSLIKPDCKVAEGCLFCDKYSVHADEKDIRKLLSCKFVLNQTRSLSTTEVFEQLFGPVFTRIEVLLNQISILIGDSKLVEDIRKQVEVDEILDAHWEHHLGVLLVTGAIN